MNVLLPAFDPVQTPDAMLRMPGRDFRGLRLEIRESFLRRAMVDSYAHLWQDPVEGLDEAGVVDVLTRL